METAQRVQNIKWAAFTAIILGLPLCASAWKMLDFREKLHELTDNSRWESTIRSHSTARPVLLFGDSQIALWPMAASFGSIPAVNRGISGDWATRAVGRFKTEFDLNMPSTTVLLMGTNDIANGRGNEEILDSLRQMIEHARAHGSRVVVCSILPASGEAALVRPAARIATFNNELRVLAERAGASYADLHHELVDPTGGFLSDYTVDGLHPSRVGYVQMTQALLPQVLAD